MEPIPNWDMEVGDVTVVENVPFGGMFEGFFVMKDSLLKPFNLFCKALVVHHSLGLLFGDRAKEAISDRLEEDCIDVGVVLKGGVDCTGQHSWWCWHEWSQD